MCSTIRLLNSPEIDCIRVKLLAAGVPKIIFEIIYFLRGDGDKSCNLIGSLCGPELFLSLPKARAVTTL